MKRILLLFSVLCFSAIAALAQTTYETALDAQVGRNSFDLPTDDDPMSIYWKMTPSRDRLAFVKPLTGQDSEVRVLIVRQNTATQKNDTINVTGAADSYPTRAFPLKKDELVFFRATGTETVGFELTLQDADNLGHGLSSDDPTNIELDKKIFMGDAYKSNSYQTYNTYASYAATQAGQLIMSLSSYVSGCKLADGTTLAMEYSNGHYDVKLPVEAGQTYNIEFRNSSPFLLTASMTHPTQGSLEMPFTLAEGANTVPAAFGEYYYKYTPTKKGFLAISSTNALPGGQVKIFSSKESVKANSPVAVSPQGTFNARTEIVSIYSTFYVLVNKIDATTTDETFNMAIEDYRPGEQENNPIEISSLPATQTLPQAAGTYYYSVTVPANTSKFLIVKAAATNVADGTTVALYPTGNSYMAVTGKTAVRMNVNSGYETKYTIRWIANENSPLAFTVEYEDIVPGDVITNPLTATLGENTMAQKGTKYYAYTPTKNCKLTVTATPDMQIAFPRGTDPYAGEYEAIVSGVKYSIEAQAATRYLITVTTTRDGDKFSLSEDEFQPGESRSNPYLVQGSKYDFTTQSAGNLWLKYVVKNDGVIDIACDADYNNNNTVEFGKVDAAGNGPLSGMVSYRREGSETISFYAGKMRVGKDETIMLHISIKGSVAGKSVTFTERGFIDGESHTKPINMQKGDTITLQEANRNNPVWVKAQLFEGKARFVADGFVGGTIYATQADAAAGTNGEAINAAYNSQDGSYTIEKDIAANQEAEYYIEFNMSYGTVKLTLESNGTPTDINSATSQTAQVQPVHGGVSITASAPVEIYRADGTLLLRQKTTHQETIPLRPGLYIIKVGPRAWKLLIK